MKQALEDDPKTPQEAARQRGPMPLTAIFLVLGLIAAFLFFFVPALFPQFAENLPLAFTDDK
ncbi:MAG: hypothetical protein DYH13_03915 [Alphaproteobacteria bacterium PRO2]|nr:hypothetical protein [Alphaproteobacteria bacterium PRO2]